MDVLVTAEGYGFGPVSKVVSVAKELLELDQSIDAYFFGEGTAYTFVSNNGDRFEDVFDAENRSVNDVFDDVEPDLVISGMEANVVFEAASRPDPPLVAFVDSLFWFWTVDDVDAMAERLADASPSSVQTDGEFQNSHEQELFAHAVADVSYVQSFPTERPDDLRVDLFEPLEFVGPIVDDRHRGDGPGRVVISLCGQLSPFVSVEEAAAYVELILDEFGDVLDQFADDGYPPLVLGNEEVLDRVDTDYETDFLEHDRYLEVLDAAPLLLCPASLTSIYEAVTYEVPVVLLPEQNSSHWPDYAGLNDGVEGTPFDGAILGDRLPQLRDLDEEEIGAIYDVLAAYRGHDVGVSSDVTDVVGEVFAETERDLDALRDPDTRAERAERQRRSIEARLPSTNGARQAATDLLKRVERGAVDSPIDH